MVASNTLDSWTQVADWATCTYRDLLLCVVHCTFDLELGVGRSWSSGIRDMVQLRRLSQARGIQSEVIVQCRPRQQEGCPSHSRWSMKGATHSTLTEPLDRQGTSICSCRGGAVTAEKKRAECAPQLQGLACGRRGTGRAVRAFTQRR